MLVSSLRSCVDDSPSIERLSRLSFNQKWLLTLILENFATAQNVRGALESSVYVNPERVTEDLVEDYLSLAKDKEAAVEVLRQIYTNDGGPLPFEAASSLPDSFPILTVWGDRDNLAPATGPVVRTCARARFRLELTPIGRMQN